MAGFSCVCPAGFTGDTCGTDSDECAAHPCQNGGTCTDGIATFTCACAPGFDGPQCAHEIDECAPHPCQHGGTCSDGIASFSCACAPGFEGPTCATNIDDCSPDPCLNGGTCIDGVNHFVCDCAAGWTGARCETNVDDCDPNPCLNGGTCVDGVGTVSCECLAGFTGATCAVDIDECAPAPCLNGGACIDGVDGFTCACLPGFSGDTCETDIDECASAPCENGGTCTDGINAFTCACAPGWEGDTCDTEIDECAPAPCLNGGVCTDLVAGFTCACEVGFEGATCAVDIDECAIDNGGCDAQVSCTDNPGPPVTCGACPDGTTRNLRDDFEDGDLSGWTFTDVDVLADVPSQWGVVGGRLVEQSGTGGTAFTGTQIVTGSVGWTDVTISALIDKAGVVGGAGLVVRRQSADTYYVVVIYGTGASETNLDPLVGGGKTWFARVEDGVPTVLWSADVSSPTGGPFTLEVAATTPPALAGDSSFAIRLNGTLLGTVTDGAIAHGAVGLHVSHNRGAAFDDVVVMPANDDGVLCTACPTGFAGPDCSVDIDECAPAPCANGGTCIDQIAAFECVCPPGFEGPTCAIDVDECATDNGGCDLRVTCSDRSGPPAACGDCPDDTTRVVREDFSDADLSDWTITNLVEGSNGNWSIDDGALVQAANSYDTVATSGSPLWSDVTVSATLMSTDNDSFGVVVRRQSAGTFYAFGLRANGGFAIKFVDGVKTNIGSVPASYTPGVPFRLSVTASGSTFTVSVDDAVVATIADDTIGYGQVGFYCRLNKGSIFDDLVVEPANNDGVICADCPSGLQGPECSLDVDECADGVCQHGGSCANTFGGFTCTCPSGWTGAECAVQVCGGVPCDDGDPCTADGCDATGSCQSAPKCADGCGAGTGRCYTCDGLVEDFEADAWLAGQSADSDVAAPLPGPVDFGGYIFRAEGGSSLFAAASPTGDPDAYRSLRVDQAVGGALRITLPQVSERVALTVWTDDPGPMDAIATWVLSGGGSVVTFSPPTAAPQAVVLELGDPRDEVLLTLGPAEIQGRRLYIDTLAHEPGLCAAGCPDTPCQNGGACDTASVPAVCICPAGWTGPQCAQNVDECLSAPCGAGTCTDTPGGFTCSCPDGRTGPRCTQCVSCDDGDPCTTDACADGVCVHGATCADACDAQTGLCGTCDDLYLDFEGDGWPIEPGADENTESWLDLTSPVATVGFVFEADETVLLQAITHPSGDPTRFRGLGITTLQVDASPVTITLPQPSRRIGLTLPSAGPYPPGHVWALTAGGTTVLFSQTDEPEEVGLTLAEPSDTLVISLASTSSSLPFRVLTIDGIGYEPGGCTDQCEPTTCDGPGTCVDEVGYGRCECEAGWTGASCALPDTLCGLGNPCLNGGFCLMGGCECPDGFEGPLCGHCGNGVVEPGEGCDDGNSVETDDCRSACVPNICGDGVIDQQGPAVEACDDGNTTSGDGCRADCLGTESCGDGQLDLGEVCDSAIAGPAPGGANNTVLWGNHVYRWFGGAAYPPTTWEMAATQCVALGGHLATVTSADEQAAVGSVRPQSLGRRWFGLLRNNGTLKWVTGEPVVWSALGSVPLDGVAGYLDSPGPGAGWQLSDSGSESLPFICEFEIGACGASCEPVCGDGITAGDEVCDDGYLGGTWNHCASDCSVVQECGDGTLEPGELCDDGDYNGLWGYCNALCGHPVCGDGVVQEGEACDDGALAGEGSCLSDCSGLQTCGDGVTQGIEACDDGPLNGTPDHCAPDCTEAMQCGDDVLQGNETCDDGQNTGELGSCWPDCRPVVPCANLLDTAPCDDGDPCTVDSCAFPGKCVNAATCSDQCASGSCYSCAELVQDFESDDWLSGHGPTDEYAVIRVSPVSAGDYTFEADGATRLAAAARPTGDPDAYRSLLLVQGTGGVVTIRLPVPATRLSLTLWTADPALAAQAPSHTLEAGGASTVITLAAGAPTTVVLELVEPAQTATLTLAAAVDGEVRVYLESIAYETALCPADQCSQCSEHTAACQDGLGAPTCTCTAGWQGPTCAEDVDECLGAPCSNGGACANTVGGFTCDCVGYWTGDTCGELLCGPATCDDGSPCTEDTCDPQLGCVSTPLCAAGCVEATGECVDCSDRVMDFEDDAFPTQSGADETSESYAALSSPLTFDGHVITFEGGAGQLAAATFPSGDPGAYRGVALTFGGVGAVATITLPESADIVTLVVPPKPTDGGAWGQLFRAEAGGAAVELAQSDVTQEVLLAGPGDTVTLTALSQTDPAALPELILDAVRRTSAVCGACGDGVVAPAEVCEPATDAPWGTMDNAVVWQTRVYKVYTQKKTWNGARNACRTLGGELATILTPEENGVVRSILTKASWMGLTSDGAGAWSWVTGEPVVWWAPGSSTSGFWGYIAINGKWSFAPTSYTEKDAYVCEFQTVGCAEDCQSGGCGDGIRTRGETCDEGTLNGVTGHCGFDCAGPNKSCGDGLVGPDEVCDDGDLEGEGACNAICDRVQTCGDGHVDGDEACDDGDDVDTDDCTTACVHNVCGDGIPNLTGAVPEACDDGNTAAGDGCRADCAGLEVCGDGLVDVGEGCDDGNVSDEDACTAACVPNVCGDGIVNASGTAPEACDDGNTESGDGCRADCRGVEACGDGLVDVGEVCDGPSTLAWADWVDTAALAGHVYRRVGTALSWGAARNACTAQGGHLATVASPQENDVVRALLSTGSWIGLSQDGDGSASWVTGEPLVWWSTLNSVSGAYGYAGPGGIWAFTSSGSGKHYVCEFESGACAGDCHGGVCGDGIRTADEACDDGPDNGTAGFCNADCTVAGAICGDGAVEGVEVCDDGNTVSGDGCRADCLSDETCGNAIVDVAAEEVCDEGPSNGTDGHCASQCDGLQLCGDGVVEGSEACDDGALVGEGACVADCSGVQRCGDGVVAGLEVCDDGALNGTDGHCSPACDGLQTCGNEVVEGTEVCDDGPQEGEWTCSNDCTGPQVCQDGVKRGSEQCDDGNATPGDGCRADCTLELCGDGILDVAAGESCDEGDDNGVPLHCTHDCDMAVECGDGVAEYPERCDDGAMNGHIGYCAAGCSGRHMCGDAVVQGSEECDPGTAALRACDDGHPLILNGTLFCVRDEAKAQGAARAECTARGGDLASIEGSAVNAPLKAFVGNLPGAQFWIGLEREAADSDSFYWLDATTTGYRNWASGAFGEDIPASIHDPFTGETTPTDRICVIVASNGWLDIACDNERGFVCEYPWACGPACTGGGCGDGIVDPGELCDDGVANGKNTTYGCNTKCDTIGVCGDGVLAGLETCDDGAANGSTFGVCNPTCTGLMACGDGVLEGYELCDDGVHNGEYGYCNATCDAVIGCGDGVVQGSETCDEGDLNGAYGCKAGATVLLGNGQRYCVGPQSTAPSCTEAQVGLGAQWAEIDAAQSAELAELLGDGMVRLGIVRQDGCPNNVFVWPSGNSLSPNPPLMNPWSSYWAPGEPTLEECELGCLPSQCVDTHETRVNMSLDTGLWYDIVPLNDNKRPLCTVARGCNAVCRGMD